MEKQDFEARVLAEPLDIVAVLDHLNDNVGHRPLCVTLTIEPRSVHEEGYCSIKKTDVKKIQIKNEKEILDISRLLLNNLFMANIHVAIE